MPAFFTFREIRGIRGLLLFSKQELGAADCLKERNDYLARLMPDAQTGGNGPLLVDSRNFTHPVHVGGHPAIEISYAISIA
jgi:hypothetical protein